MLSDEKNTVQSKQWLDKFCSDSGPSEITVKRRYANFKRSRIATNDAKHQKTPQTRFGRS